MFGLDFIVLVDRVYLWVKVDYFTRCVRVDLCDKANAQQMIRGLERWLKTRGSISFIRMDGGKHFDNSRVATRLHARGIEHKHSLPYDHRSNGLSERCNRTVLQVLRKCKSHHLQSP